MQKVSDIVAVLEEAAPPRLAEDWDNVGLLVGRADRTVSRVYVALDPSPEVVEGAVAAQAQLLVTHHPLLFRPIKRLDLASPLGRTLETALKNDLAIYAAHTNLDRARGGVNEILAARLGLSDCVPLGAASADERDFGLGCVGNLFFPTDLAGLARVAAARLGAGVVRIAGDPLLPVTRAALCAGSGRSLVALFLASDAEVFITGDISHHEARDIVDAGRGLVDAGHFATEHGVVEALCQLLSRKLSGHGVDVCACPFEKDPFRLP